MPVPLCECGRPATSYEAYDTDCGNVAEYMPACDVCLHGDYAYCLVCLGHIDDNETDGCSKCTCEQVSK